MKRVWFPIFAAAVLLGNATLTAGQVVEPKGNAEFLKKSAFQIDQFVAAFYRRQKLDVPAVTDDATFLRRAFLIAVGRIPSSEEAVAFMEMNDPAKREQLVDYLLKSPGYGSHMSNWTFDLLRMVDYAATDLRLGAFEPYRVWLRSAIDNNMAWDEMTQALLSSVGNGWDPKTAAVGYYTQDFGMPLDNLANSMRIFLGARMECAQCHDDPFGKTERHDFYRLAAFTHGQEGINNPLYGPLFGELSGANQVDGDEYAFIALMRNTISYASLAGGGTGNIALPEDYQYKDGKPGDMVGAGTPFGKTVRMSENEDSGKGRKAFADWVTQGTGNQFATVIANRMWRRVMGKGIYEPYDDYVAPEKTHYPELVTYLAKLMVDLDYDLRAFQHVLLLTRTFQFGTNPKESIIADGDDFHGRKIERLSAEQIWDSLITLAVGNPDSLPRRGIDQRIVIRGKNIKWILPDKTMEELSKEVVAIKTEAEMRSFIKDVMQKANAPGGTGDLNARATHLPASMTTMGPMGSMSTAVVIPSSIGSIARASELTSPAPRDHFLYLFGQSDRQVIDGASREPNVGQMLSLMNGFVQEKLVNNSEAHIYKSLNGLNSDSEKIKRLYLTILNRPPVDEEMGWMLGELKLHGESGYRNIVSSLIMSSEFLFLQ